MVAIVQYDGRKQLLSKMTMISPRMTSPRRALLPALSPRRVAPGAGDHMPASPVAGYRRTDQMDIFDGRMTTPRQVRLQTATRSRRVEAPTGAPIGKDGLGLALPQRIHLRALQGGCVTSPCFVNDAREGSAMLSCFDVVPPSNCPKGQTFSRLAVAIGRGGCFERSFAGCVPFSP